ncbi:MAG: VanZ family protein [Rhodothermales bacterium]
MPNRSLLLAIAWTLFIVALCSIPCDDIPDMDIWGYDKIGHFVMFAGFGWLWAHAAPKNALGWVLAAGVAFAGLTEVYQGLLPFDRTPDLYDALADIIGLSAGLLVYRLQKHRRARQQPA